MDKVPLDTVFSGNCQSDIPGSCSKYILSYFILLYQVFTLIITELAEAIGYGAAVRHPDHTAAVSVVIYRISVGIDIDSSVSANVTGSNPVIVVPKLYRPRATFPLTETFTLISRILRSVRVYVKILSNNFLQPCQLRLFFFAFDERVPFRAGC